MISRSQNPKIIGQRNTLYTRSIHLWFSQLYFVYGSTQKFVEHNPEGNVTHQTARHRRLRDDFRCSFMVNHDRIIQLVSQPSCSSLSMMAKVIFFVLSVQRVPQVCSCSLKLQDERTGIHGCLLMRVFIIHQFVWKISVSNRNFNVLIRLYCNKFIETINF